MMLVSHRAVDGTLFRFSCLNAGIRSLRAAENATSAASSGQAR
jgi:hypothetical protein